MKYKYSTICCLLMIIGVEVPPLTKKQAEDGKKNLKKLIEKWKKYVNKKKE